MFAARLEVERAGERMTIEFRPVREIGVPRILPSDATLRVLAGLRASSPARP